MPPLIGKLTAMDVRGILDFQIEVQTIIRFSSVLIHEKHWGLSRGLGTLPEGRPQWAKTLAEKGRNKTKREQKLFALCCL